MTLIGHRLKSGLDSGPWTLDSTFYICSVQCSCVVTGGGGGIREGSIGRCRIIIFYSIDFNHFLFLADSGNIVQ